MMQILPNNELWILEHNFSNAPFCYNITTSFLYKLIRVYDNDKFNAGIIKYIPKKIYFSSFIYYHKRNYLSQTLNLPEERKTTANKYYMNFSGFEND